MKPMVLLLAAVPVLTFAGYAPKFTDRDKVQFNAAEWKVSADGGEIACTKSAAMYTISFLNLPDTGSGMKLSFDAKIGRDPAIKSDGHCGLMFSTMAGETGQLFTRGKGSLLILKSPGGKEIVSGPCMGEGEVKSNEWTRITVLSSCDTMVCTIGGETCTWSNHGLTPLKTLKFYMYNRFAAIRNFKIEAMNDVASEGTIYCWVKYEPGTDIARITDENGKTKAKFMITDGAPDKYGDRDCRIDCNIAAEGSDKPITFERRMFGALRGYDDFHFAFTWRKDGKVRIFLDGVPFSVGQLGYEKYKGTMLGNALNGKLSGTAGEGKGITGKPQKVTGLKVLDHALTNREVLDEYRKRMPVDLVTEDSIVPCDTMTEMKFTLAPGGRYMRPTPCEGYPEKKAKVDVAVVVERAVYTKDEYGRKISGYEMVPGSRAEYRGVEVNDLVELTSGKTRFARGRYRMTVTVRNDGAEAYSRTLVFNALKDVALAKVEPDNREWERETLLFERKIRRPEDMEYGEGTARTAKSAAGEYLELGENGGFKSDRKACIIDFPKGAIGKPCLLEIEWPDDKSRLMGFYTYLESPVKPQHRDRTQGGVAAGDVLRNSNKMQVTEYLFFPSSTNHLFEIRTLGQGRPAAIASLKVWKLKEPLPVLKIRKPGNLPQRRMGHMDEDQTFFMMLNDVAGDDMADTRLTELFRYYAYTGQNTLQYTIFRYADTLFPAERQFRFAGFNGGQGEFPWVWRQFRENGVNFTGEFFMFTVPQITRVDETDCEYEKKGFCLLDDEGYGVNAHLFAGLFGNHAPNIANPEMRKMYFAYLEDSIVRAAKQGVKEWEIPAYGSRLVGGWLIAEAGYDDWTWRRFLADTGLKDDARFAAVQGEAKQPADYAARAALAKQEDVKAKRLEWRAKMVTEYYTDLVNFIRSKVPDARIYLTIGDMKGAYEEHGFDYEALAAIPGASVAVERNYTGYWWNAFRPGRVADTNAWHRMYDGTSPAVLAAKKVRGGVDLMRSAAEYFETFKPSSENNRFKCYFQNADVKPWGRHWLREPAYAIGALDALAWCVGNEPLGTLGRERETREFAQAFCALPAVHFQPVKGSDDGKVVCRSAFTENGTYFYLVNMTDRACSAGVRFDSTKNVYVMDLSSGKTGKWTAYPLKPYQLRSFLIPKQRIAVRQISQPR